MRWPFLLILGAFCATSLGAEGWGRTDLVWKLYLSETVRRGLPLGDAASSTPFWPALDRARRDAAVLEPSDDLTLLNAWIDAAEGQPLRRTALQPLGPQPQLSRWPQRVWFETLFRTWDPRASAPEWTQAWLAWNEKAYSPRALRDGLEALELTDPSAVVPLLKQALALYPQDRRFLPLLARHPAAHPATLALLQKDVRVSGGWSASTMRALLDRAPEARPLLLQAGYAVDALDAAQARDYGWWLKNGGAPPLEGSWDWDADGDGRAESTVVFDQGRVSSWSRRTADGLWTLSLRDGKPVSLVETRLGASWSLIWEDYPASQSLTYRWGNRSFVYRFAPYTVPLALWPAERWSSPPERLPAALATLWLPLDPRGLAQKASSIETWNGSVRTQTAFLAGGEVWLQVDDTNADGVDDQWSFFRGGVLASVYADPEGRGNATLREVYRKGELAQVQKRADDRPRVEFVNFPLQGVQLWDPHGAGSPLDRVFQWTGDERLQALVFRQSALPWDTMPPWEPRP